MKPINIYALTRVSEAARIERLERQMSERTVFLKSKDWEMLSLKSFCEKLLSYDGGMAVLKFYFSFSLPKLGKEFDLLRLDDNSVVNVELKSQTVSDKAIQNQLLQNKYYLAMLERNMYFFTYVSSTGRLVRLSKSGRLVEASWEKLIECLKLQKDCYTGHLEELFRENQYLISPLTDPDRFLRGDYVLTSQQRDIKKKIIRLIRKKETCVQGFTGLPGTGKTILLYDLAMELSANERVCLFHFGAYPKGIEQLNDRLKRVDFYCCGQGEDLEIQDRYRVIFVDEGHRIEEKLLKEITEYARAWQAPVIISYDSEVPIAPAERKKRSDNLLENIPGFVRYQLTNRIRLNNEMSAFIGNLMCVWGRNHRREYPNVSVFYAADFEEAKLLMQGIAEAGYVYIRDTAVDSGDNLLKGSWVDISEATSREFDKVVMVVDGTFFYDEDGYLRSRAKEKDGRVRHLYHGLNRAKERIAVIIIENMNVFDRLLGILQHI